MGIRALRSSFILPGAVPSSALDASFAPLRRTRSAIMKWDVLDKPQLAEFLDRVKTEDEAVLFRPGATQAQRLPLPFYRDFALYRLSNFASIPLLTFHYLGDGTRFFYLDGTDAPLMTVNQAGGLSLTAGNVIAYLNFYFFSVRQAEGEVYLVHDPAAYPFQDQMSFDPADTLADLGRLPPAYEIRAENDGGFVVETPVFLDGTLVRAQIRVDPHGRVVFLSERLMIRENAGTTNMPPFAK